MKRTADGWKCDTCGAQMTGPMAAIYAHDCRPPRPEPPPRPATKSRRAVYELAAARLAEKADLELTAPEADYRERLRKCTTAGCRRPKCPRFPGCDWFEKWINFLSGSDTCPNWSPNHGR